MDQGFSKMLARRGARRQHHCRRKNRQRGPRNAPDVARPLAHALVDHPDLLRHLREQAEVVGDEDDAALELLDGHRHRVDHLHVRRVRGLRGVGGERRKGGGGEQMSARGLGGGVAGRQHMKCALKMQADDECTTAGSQPASRQPAQRIYAAHSSSALARDAPHPAAGSAAGAARSRRRRDAS